MEDKQLNFNRPLLSARRFSSTVSSQKDFKSKNGTSISPSPSYKYSGPLRNAGSVPFVWEQSPGRPKDETDSQKNTNNLVPKLPPGRISKPKSLGPQNSVTPTQVKVTEFHSSKETKKQASNEKPLEVKKVVVNREAEKPQITYGPNFLQFNGDDSSDDDSEFDYDEHENTSYSKVCGLLPHFCLKGSIGLLNPLPGLSMRTRLPISSANKTPLATSSAISQPARVAVYEHRSLAKPQKDTISEKDSKEASNLKSSQSLERSDHLQDRVVLNNDINSENSLQKKGLISFKELLAVENEKEEASLQNHVVEKTLYVDTIHKVEETAELPANEEGVFGISHITPEPLDESKQDKEMGFCEVDQDLKVSRQSTLELPAPPPLPKSPSDSWLWRTLPSRAKPEKFQLRNPQGKLLAIQET